MVNLEPGRDYYADLEITPQATANDVKKQFKKLALKYHPDRNPGQELEYNSKFQAISAANEILTDPALRAKFDAQRLREGPPRPFSESSARPNVPPRTRTTNFPPPPKPPPPSTNKPQASTGARRYDNFARPSSTWGGTDPEDARKTHDYRAFEQMRHGQGPIPKSRPPPSRSPRTTTFETKHTSPPGRSANGASSRVRRTWEDLKDAGMPYLGKNQPSRPTSKKTGHGTPEDEKQAQSAYFNVFNGDHPKRTTEMHPPPRPRHQVPPRYDPLDPHSRDHPGHQASHNSARPRMPYHNLAGEKTHLTSPGLHRSATTATPRDVKSQAGFNNRHSQKMNGDHHHSASAGAANHDTSFRSSNVSSATTSATTSSDEDDDDHTYGKAPADRETRVPRSRKARMPAGAGIRMRTGFSPHVRDGNQDEGQAPHPGYADFRRHSGIDLPTQKSFSEKPEGFAAHRSRHDTLTAGPQFAKPAPNDQPGDRAPQRHKSFDDRYRSPSGDNGRTTMYEPPGHSPLSFLHYSGPLPSEKWSKHKLSGPLEPPKLSDAEMLSLLTNLCNTPTVSKGKIEPIITRSTPVFSNISKTISPFANHNFTSFEMSAHDQRSTATPPIKIQTSEGINMNFSPAGSPPKFGNQNPFSPRQSPEHVSKDTNEGSNSQETSPTDTRAPNERHLASDIPPPPKVGDKWSAEDWERRFGVHTFDIPAGGTTSRATSRKRSGTSRTSSLNNLRRTAFRSNGFQPTVVDDGDEPGPSDAPQAESMSRDLNGSRMSNGSNGSAMDIDSTPPATSDSKPTRAGQPSPLVTQDDAQPTTEASLPKNDMESQRLNLGDFRHVAPFAPTKGGLNGINDLNDSLPFESRPSPTRPDFEKCNQPLDLPRPPKCPSPPQVLNDETWHDYLEKMNSYIFHWNSFNRKILMLFDQRQEGRREIGPSWLRHAGGDCEAYLEGLEAEEKARKWWDVAWDHHKEAMMNLKNVREKVLKAKGKL